MIGMDYVPPEKRNETSWNDMLLAMKGVGGIKSEHTTGDALFFNVVGVDQPRHQIDLHNMFDELLAKHQVSVISTPQRRLTAVEVEKQKKYIERIISPDYQRSVFQQFLDEATKAAVEKAKHAMNITYEIAPHHGNPAPLP